VDPEDLTEGHPRKPSASWRETSAPSAALPEPTSSWTPRSSPACTCVVTALGDGDLEIRDLESTTDLRQRRADRDRPARTRRNSAFKWGRVEARGDARG
jgi:hypothetical protein